MDKEYKYMVTTRCFTYNHASYIEDALKGFSMQETDFPMVYCIVDDASNDHEPDILRTWATNNLDLNEDGIAYRKNLDYGEIIVAHLKKKNNCLFVILLLSSNHKQAGKSKLQYLSEWLDNSKYLALCEGDDYWINPNKLKMQVNFMESHPAYSMCFHNAKTIDVETGEPFDKFHLPNKSCEYTAAALFSKGWFAPTASMLFKNLNIPEELRRYKKEQCPKAGGDIVQQLFLASKGLFWFMSDTMSVYRFGVPGSATMASKSDDGESYKQYLKLLSYANRTLFENRYYVFILYRRLRFFIRQLLFRS